MFKAANFIIRITLAITFLMFMSISVFSQEKTEEKIEMPPTHDWNVKAGIELPIGKTQWEIEHEYLFPYNMPLTDDPPPQPSVNPAEWEPMTGALIRYPLGLSYSLVAEMSEDVIITTIVSSTSQMNTVSNLYLNNGVNMTNTDWLIAPSNSMWTRDYGPWFIFTGNDVQGISNHTYNRPTRPDDNMIPVRFGEANNIPVYDLPLIHSGGNHMSDGMGISMSTDLVYDENPTLSQAQVDDYIQTWLGNDYFVMDDILGGGIHHIDCWGKMLTPGKILAKRLNPPNAVLEANVALLENTISSYGVPYEVIRIDCASSTPYTNGLILNNKVLVPLFNNALDAQAMQTWADAMPGYEILGYTGSWVSDDAIHCRVMGVTDRYMLRIVHVPLHQVESGGGDYLVEATIHPYSNEPISAGFPVIFWKTEGGTFTSAEMTTTGDDVYQGYIPEQPNFTDVYYYIHAEESSGRRENHPYIGAPGAHHFVVFPDTIAPVIVHNSLPDLSTYEWPATISAFVTDNLGVEEVFAEYEINGIPQQNIPLTLNNGVYEGQLAGTVSIGDIVEYRIVAVDISVNQNTTYSPEAGMYQVEIVPGYMSDMEDGAPDWSHSVVTPTFGDEWHLSTAVNHTPGGIQAWKCGSQGTGNYGNLLDAGLVSPEYNIGNTSHLSFWHTMNAEISSSYPGYAYDGGIVEVSVDGGDWTQIAPVGGYPYLVRIGTTAGPFPAETPIFSGTTAGWELVTFDLTGISGDVSFRFRFGSDGSAGGNGWCLDDVLIVDSGTGASLVEVTMTPENPPITVPANGGTFNFNIQVSNLSTNPVNVDIWTMATLPNGSEYGPIINFPDFQLPGSASPNRDRTQAVPASAPSGMYSYDAYVGEYPNIVWAEDHFDFQKSAADDGGSIVSGWENWGENFDNLASELTIPVEYSFDPAYPNPFNPTTTLSYSLPVGENVNLTVFDVQGREITRLVQGYKTAGTHTVEFNASMLPSGVYFAHFKAGSFTETRKLLLVK